MPAKVRTISIPEARIREYGVREIKEIPPRKGVHESNGILVRASGEEREFIKKAARMVGESAGYFTLCAALERATKVLHG